MDDDEYGLFDVTSAGNRLKTLEFARNQLAAEMDRLQRCQSANEAAGRDFALMVKELRAILAEIDEVGGVTENDSLDELTQRRNDRRAGA